jgi:hypothetical protein
MGFLKTCFFFTNQFPPWPLGFLFWGHFEFLRKSDILHFVFIAGVNDNGDKLIVGVNDTGDI